MAVNIKYLFTRTEYLLPLTVLFAWYRAFSPQPAAGMICTTGRHNPLIPGKSSRVNCAERSTLALMASLPLYEVEPMYTRVPVDWLSRYSLSVHPASVAKSPILLTFQEKSIVPFGSIMVWLTVILEGNKSGRGTTSIVTFPLTCALSTFSLLRLLRTTLLSMR